VQMLFTLSALFAFNAFDTVGWASGLICYRACENSEVLARFFVWSKVHMIGLTLLVPAYSGSPRKEAAKCVSFLCLTVLILDDE